MRVGGIYRRPFCLFVFFFFFFESLSAASFAGRMSAPWLPAGK